MLTASPPVAQPLLAPDEPSPARVLPAAGPSPFLFICDHAGRRTPRRLGDMGLAPDAWARHIAWDIGAAELTERLAARFGAAAVLQRYSRLVIDCNRDPARADAIPAVSDGVEVRANRELAPASRARRVAEVHAPYHAAIAAELDARMGDEPPVVPVFVHSFTPRLQGMTADRPWRFGVLHLGGSPMADATLALLRAEGGFEVGDNEPYAMDAIDYSAPRHAVARGLDFLELEVRQDLIADPDGVDRVGRFLGRLLPQALARSRAGGAGA